MRRWFGGSVVSSCGGWLHRDLLAFTGLGTGCLEHRVCGALVAARCRVWHAFPDSEESRTEHLGAGRFRLWALSPLSYLAALPVHPVEPPVVAGFELV
jgi:hypothetical protein